MPEPPYPGIAQLFQKGEVVPFLGAGVNAGARPQESDPDPSQLKHLPTGAELSEYLAFLSSFPYDGNDSDRRDLPKVASYYVDTIGREPLRLNLLREVFTQTGSSFEPRLIHRCIAAIERPLLIITTNYDDLMERALIDCRKEFDVVSHVTDRPEIAASVHWWTKGNKEPTAVSPNMLDIDPTKTTVVYKMHGTINRDAAEFDSFVVTEDDYIDFLAGMTAGPLIPSILDQHLKQRHLLFLGYGLADWNFRILFRKLKPGTASKRIHWAIQRDPKDFERTIWDRRGVSIYSVDVDEFAGRLMATMGIA